MYYYNLKTIASGNRLETYQYSLAIEKDFVGKNSAGRKGIRKPEDRNIEKNRKQVLNRARNKIIRLVNCNPDLETFITFTYAENMQNLRQSKEDLSKCLKKIQRECEYFKYMYVLEFQERGAIHYHMLCNLQMPIKTAGTNKRKSEEQKKFERYFADKYWGHGFVDIRNLKDEGNTNVGLYVSVYLVEDLFTLDLKGAKCYGFSRNLEKPREEVMFVSETFDKVFEEFSKNYEPVYANSYSMKVEYADEMKYGTVNYFDYYRR